MIPEIGALIIVDPQLIRHTVDRGHSAQINGNTRGNIVGVRRVGSRIIVTMDGVVLDRPEPPQTRNRRHLIARHGVRVPVILKNVESGVAHTVNPRLRRVAVSRAYCLIGDGVLIN